MRIALLESPALHGRKGEVVSEFYHGGIPDECPYCHCKGKKKPFIFPKNGGCVCGSCGRLIRSHHWSKEGCTT